MMAEMLVKVHIFIVFFFFLSLQQLHECSDNNFQLLGQTCCRDEQLAR